MKIPGRNDFIIIGENGWIICHRIYFGKQNIRDIIDRVAGSAMDLWNTTEGIRILHMFLLAFDKLTAFQNIPDVFSDIALSLMRANFVDKFVEGFRTAIKCF